MIAGMESSSTAAEPRLWRGRTQDERQAERRERLRTAAMRIVEESGVDAIAVRSVCREARLTERYFYESYASIDDLVGELYDTVVDEVYSSIRQADEADDDPVARGEASIRVLARILLADRAKSRIFVMELSSPGLLGAHLQRKLAMKRDLMGGIVDRLSDGRLDEVDREINVRSLMASQTQIFLAWAAGEIPADEDRLVRHLHRILRAVVAVSSAPAT